VATARIDDRGWFRVTDLPRLPRPPQLTLRDFQRLDGAIAALAQSLGLAVHALDTGERFT
jgi:hypothetical protein